MSIFVDRLFTAYVLFMVAVSWLGYIVVNISMLVKINPKESVTSLKFALSSLEEPLFD